ncbi:hypothetical protein LJK88_27835 [Paenibacillus sp. P26]|nr:hypothetical protein LJK88_27835 [Paenibacillus sp. P26]
MIIRCARIDRYVFDGYVHSSRTAQEWIREARRTAPWFTTELFADFFMCFYLQRPEIDRGQEASPSTAGLWMPCGSSTSTYRSIRGRPAR